MKYTVRSLVSPYDLDNGKTILDLPIAFESDDLDACRRYCLAEDYEWRVDTRNIFGGYYANDEGDCLLLV